jgi:hypothetical protein
MKLVTNPQLKSWVEAYAQDEQMFFRNYAKAHVKVSEIGQEANLLSEFEPNRIIDGGYVEESRLGKVMLAIRSSYSAFMTNQTQEEFLEAEEE